MFLCAKLSIAILVFIFLTNFEMIHLEICLHSIDNDVTASAYKLTFIWTDCLRVSFLCFQRLEYGSCLIKLTFQGNLLVDTFEPSSIFINFNLYFLK